MIALETLGAAVDDLDRHARQALEVGVGGGEGAKRERNEPQEVARLREDQDLALELEVLQEAVAHDFDLGRLPEEEREQALGVVEELLLQHGESLRLDVRVQLCGVD